MAGFEWLLMNQDEGAETEYAWFKQFGDVFRGTDCFGVCHSLLFRLLSLAYAHLRSPCCGSVIPLLWNTSYTPPDTGTIVQ